MTATTTLADLPRQQSVTTERPQCPSWVDLLDPSEAQIRAHLPVEVHSQVLAQMSAPSHLAGDSRQVRPWLEAHGDHVFGVFLVAVSVNEDDCVYYQEIDVLLTCDALLTVRKTPLEGRPAYDVQPARAACRNSESLGMTMYRLVDDIAERYLELTDRLSEEIDEIEDNIETWSSDRVRRRI